MSKIDELKEKKTDLREVFKALLYVVLGLFTGIITIVYQVLANKVPASMILLGGIGLVVVFLVAIYTLKLWFTMQKINKDMKDV